MLFLLFFITYDFDSEEDYKIDIDNFNTSNEVIELIDDSIKNSTLNIASIEVNEALLNKIIFTYFQMNLNDKFKSEAFEIRGLKIRIKNNNFYLDIHTLYKAFNYNSKITICFSLTSTENEFIFQIKRINFGKFILPKSFVRSILDNKDINSVGYLVNSAIESLPYGELDVKDFLFKIRRQEISSSIYNGYFNELFFNNDELFSKTSATIIDLLLSNNLVDISLENGLLIKIDYSKIVSNPERIIFNNEVDDLKNKEAKKTEIIYNTKFNILLGENEVSYSYIDLNYLIDPGLYIEGFFSIKRVRSFLLNGEFHIMCHYSFSEINSIIDYIFDSNFKTLKRIEVGRDNGESDSSYILINTPSELRIFLNLLFEGNLSGNLNDLSLDLPQSFSSFNTDISSLNINGDFLYINFNNDFSDEEKIISVLSDINFYSNLSLNVYESLDSKESIILNYKNYGILEKKAIVNSLKNIFKEDENIMKLLNSLYGGY